MKFDEICSIYGDEIFDVYLKDIFISDKLINFEIKVLDNNLVGYIAYKDLVLSNDVYYLFVKDKFRNRGYAKELLNRIFYKDILVEVDVENFMAISLYEGLGFIRQKVIKNYYKNGNDAIVLLNCYNDKR